MNLDKYIRIQLMELSKLYNISIIEITKAEEDRIKKSFKVIYSKKEKNSLQLNEIFFSKRDLVSWLVCLK